MLTTRVALSLTAGALALATLLAATPARAQMYTYTDPATGKRIISNTPPPAGTQAKTLTPEDRPAPLAPPPPPPAPAPAPPAAADTQAAELLEKVSAMLDKVAPKGPPGRTAAQGPVDTRELGNISPGMTQTSVRARLGGPSEVRQDGTVKRRTASGIVEVPRETWVYPGNDRVPATEVYFEGGVVVSTARAR
jgi:hypothetical protein